MPDPSQTDGALPRDTAPLLDTPPAEVFVCTLFQTAAQRLGIKPKGKR